MKPSLLASRRKRISSCSFSIKIFRTSMLRPASDNCCCWKIGDFFSKYHAKRLKLNVCRFIDPIMS